jgi:hypothetical protein
MISLTLIKLGPILAGLSLVFYSELVRQDIREDLESRRINWDTYTGRYYASVVMGIIGFLYTGIGLLPL